jgi:hypothetical protein
MIRIELVLSMVDHYEVLASPSIDSIGGRNVPGSQNEGELYSFNLF